jgi:dimethylargininase
MQEIPMPMPEQSFRFTRAIARRPSPRVVDGLRAVDVGPPDFGLISDHHSTYLAALKEAGMQVEVLEADDRFPDSVFVEDAALCLPEGAIVMRPGAPSRLGEAALMANTLAGYYANVITISAPGFIEGGDILVSDREVLVGLSERTNEAGFNQVAEIASQWGYAARMLQTPDGVLHFKTDCGLLDGETILATKRLAESGCFTGYKVIEIPAGEEPAANAIRVNDHMLLASGFPKTADLLTTAGYAVKTLPNSEAAKLDGGLSCMSLRFSPL